MDSLLVTRTLTGEELEQAQNFSRKFWLDKNNAPSAETMEILKIYGDATQTILDEQSQE